MILEWRAFCRYNEATRESRWADKFKPPRNGKRQAAPASSAQPVAPKLRESLARLTYDDHAPVCARHKSDAFVGSERAPGRRALSAPDCDS